MRQPMEERDLKSALHGSRNDNVPIRLLFRDQELYVLYK